ncbi:MAG: T9SS type A sorting domain-containing protein, partial [Candidatus Kapabacteria bacterium]|nr:T9SS type A sorting domain-containing protein [Candidatus Kapabacteria bacterium]
PCSTNPVSNPASFTSGTTTVYVFVSHNNDEKCNSDTIPVQLNVIAVPNPGTSADVSICNTEPCVNFWIFMGPDVEIGGTWSDNDGTGVDLNYPHCVEFFDVSAGTYTFTYSVQDPAGLCPEATSDLTITVSEPGNPGADNYDVFCGAPSTPVNIVSYLNNDFDPGGSWSNTGSFNMSNPASVNMSTASVGTYYFYYEVENAQCGAVYSTITIQIISEPNPGTDNSLTVCNDGINTVLNLGAALGPHDLNGAWIDDDGSGVNLSNPNYVDFDGVPSGVYHFTYIIYQNGNCPEVQAVITVTVGAGAFAGTDGSDAICEGSTQLIDLFLYLGSSYDPGGSWTQLSGNFVSLSNPHSVSFAASPEGSYNFQYAVTGACGTDVATVTIVVNSSLNAGTDYTYTACQNKAVNLFDSLTNYKLGGYWIDEYGNVIGTPLNLNLDSVKTYVFKYIFAGSNSGKVSLSTDNGNSWQEKSNGLTGWHVSTIAIDGNNIFVGISKGDGGVFVSTDNGNSWTKKTNELTNIDVQALLISGDNILAGTVGSGILVSTDNGESWTQKTNGLTNQNVWTLAQSGNNIFAGTSDGVFLTTDNGNNWIKKSDIVIMKHVQEIAVNEDYIFVGTWISGIFRAKISDLVASSVNDEFSSNGNLKIYPNPVSELLTIGRNGVGRAEIVITNTIGQTVYTGTVAAGEQNACVPVAEYPDGIYFINMKYDDGTTEFQKFVKSGK